MTQDIIKAFPPEIWIPCIAEACHGERYMANLSTFTTVSPYWGKRLIEARSLWASIHVNDCDEESMAMIPTFLLLSGSYKLSLTIWVPLSAKWDALIPIFVAHRHRIHEICLRSYSLSHRAGCSFKYTDDDHEFCDSLKRVLNNLRRPKSIEYLDVMAERPVALRLDWVPPNLLSARNWLVHEDFLTSPGHRFKLDHLSIRAEDLTTLLRHPSASEQVRHLYIYSNRKEFPSPASLINVQTLLYLPFLTTLQSYGLFSIDLIGLFNSATRSLQMLDLHIGIIHLDMAIRALNQCEILRHLSLALLLYEPASEYGNKPLPAFDGIKSAISNLERVNWLPGRLKYFECKLNSTANDPVIQKLNLDTLWIYFYPLFSGLHALVWNIAIVAPVELMIIADLLQFSVICQKVFTVPKGFVFTQLISLALTINKDVEDLWEISAEDFPFLKVLSVIFMGSRTRFDLLDFSSLEEITIGTRLPTFTQGIQFCNSLLQEPQKCPRLERINLDSFLEWDILYVALRRRNFHTTRVSRIKRMRVPSVPAKFRHIFAPLLAGTEVLPTSITLKLSYLSIQEAQSRLLDVRRKGCFRCVQLGFTGCDEPLRPSVLPRKIFTLQEDGRSINEIVEPLGLFPLYEGHLVIHAPSGGPKDEDLWMKGHQKRIKKWRSAAFQWSKSNQRILMCHMQRCSPMTTLTEYDMEDHDNYLNAKMAQSYSLLKPSAAPQIPPSRRIYYKPNYHDEFAPCALSIVKRIQNLYPPFRSRAASTFAALAMHDEFREVLITIIESLIRQPQNEDSYNPGEIGSTLVELASRARLHDTVLAAIELLINQLEDQNDRIRSAAAVELAVLATHSELRATVQTATKSLTRHLKNEDQNIKRVTGLALAALSVHAGLRYAVRDQIETLVEQLQDTSIKDQLNTASGLKLLAEYEELSSIIKDCIPRLFEFSYGQGPDVQQSSVSIFCTLAENDDFRSITHTGIPPMIKLLNDVGPGIRASIINSILKLAKFDNLRSLIYNNIPPMIELLNDTDAGVRSAAVNLIFNLTEFDDVLSLVHTGTPSMIKLLNDPDASVRSSVINSLSKLAEFSDLRRIIRSGITQMINLLIDADVTFQSNAIKSISKLAQFGDLRDLIHAAILQSNHIATPKLIKLIDGNPDVNSGAANLTSELSKFVNPRVIPGGQVGGALAGRVRKGAPDFWQELRSLERQVVERVLLSVGSEKITVNSSGRPSRRHGDGWGPRRIGGSLEGGGTGSLVPKFHVLRSLSW